MGEARLFHVVYGGAHELVEAPFQREKELQQLFESQLRALTGIDMLASEYQAGRHRRIDTLGIDAQGCPVVIEYKRSQNESIINQGLHYLDWLKNHQADIELLVCDTPGIRSGRRININGAWLLCVARDFAEWDLSTAKEVNRRVELLRCRRFGEEHLILEWVYGKGSSEPAAVVVKPTPYAEPVPPPAPEPVKPVLPHVQPRDVQPRPDRPNYAICRGWRRADESLRELFAELETTLESFGNDVHILPRAKYIAFKCDYSRSLASVHFYASDRYLLVKVPLDPDSVPLERGFMRDMRKEKWHPGPGNLGIKILDHEGLEKARPWLREAYERR